jgi:hypothetical protein
MKKYYKIMDWDKKCQDKKGHIHSLKTLFHANDGSKIIPMKEWIYASRYAWVHDGSSGTKYLSGWHVFETMDEAKDYLFNGFKNTSKKVIVECYIMGDIRPKTHSRANVWLSQGIYLNEIKHFNFVHISLYERKSC